jgi:hypothetical protein
MLKLVRVIGREKEDLDAKRVLYLCLLLIREKKLSEFARIKLMHKNRSIKFYDVRTF